MGTKPPNGAQTIDSYEDLLTAFTQIDQRLHRICEGDSPPYIYRNKLYLPASMFAIHMAAIGSGGERVSLGGATAQLPVTEASAATTMNYVYRGISGIPALGPTVGPFYGGLDASDVYRSMAYHRIYPVAITIAGGGAVANVPLHATATGYKFHFKVLGLWMDVADATTTWFFHSTAGSAACTGCPATPGFSPVNITATYTMIDQLSGAYMANAAATGDVTLLDVAGVGAGAANGYIFLEGWFETT